MPNRESWPGRLPFEDADRVSPSLPTRRPRQTRVSGPPASGGTAEKDSPLEEAVTSEPVSEAPKFLASWENTGKLIDLGLRRPNFSSKAPVGSETYGQNSLRYGTGK